jgi:hypothetical protein
MTDGAAQSKAEGVVHTWMTNCGPSGWSIGRGVAEAVVRERVANVREEAHRWVENT